VRVQTRWHNKDRERDAKQTASALAFITWKTTLNSMKNMGEWGFVIGSTEHHFQVAQEFVAFLVQATDRYAHPRLGDEERAQLITAMAKRLAEIIEENQFELLGPGDYRRCFIDLLNSRLADYAELSYTEDGPGYSALRYFGERVAAGLDADNQKWVIEQVVEIEAPKTIEHLRKGLRDLIPDPAAQA